jgi:hypothetical protein
MADVRKITEIGTNIAILAVCCLIGWTIITHKSLDLRSVFAARAGEAQFDGRTLPALPGYRWADHEKTLVLAIRKGCHFCQDSLPFYKRLSELEKSNTLHAHLLAVMPDDPASGVAALQSGGVIAQGIFNQPLNSIQVSGTPTLLLLDRNGRVVKAWVGELTSQREREVIAASER